ncbi:MAG: hypothetical protein ACKODU_03905, partial [Limnohabitans sp.]
MRRQQGASVLEALVASALLALGLSGAAHLGWQSLQLGDETRERAWARQLAQDLLECHVLGWPDCPLEQDRNIQGIRYQLQVLRSAQLIRRFAALGGQASVRLRDGQP